MLAPTPPLRHPPPHRIRAVSGAAPPLAGVVET